MEQKLGRYIVGEQLGEGSFAFVYRARDEDLGRDVALKVLKPIWMSDPTAIGRFKQEARTMARLDKNAHIAIVYEVGEAEGQVFLAQLLVDGETLGDRLARGPLTWPELLDIMRPIASALDYAHSQGVIHRDIKPANILLDQAGKPYLGDFGLVRAAESSASLSASIAGVKGTAAYIPPEVWEGEEVTPAVDIYALSCVAFEMLTGKVLYDGSSMMAVMRQIDRGPEFPDRWPEGIPPGVTAILQRGLAPDPAERYRSAGELVVALEALDEHAEAVMPTAATSVGETVTEDAATPTEATSPAAGDTPEPETEPEPVAVSAAAVEPVAAPPEPVPSPPPAAPTPVPAAPPPAAKSSKNRMLVIAGVVVAVLVVVCGAGLFLMSGEDSTPTDESPARMAEVAEAEDPTPTPQPTATAVAEEPSPDPTEEIAEEADLNPDELAERAWNNIDQGNYEQAIADFDQAIELDPDNAIHYGDRGWAYYLAEQYEQAIADYNQALTLGSDELVRGGNLAGLGQAYEDLGQFEQAMTSYREAIDSYQAGGEDYGWIEERIAGLEAKLGSVTATEPAQQSVASSQYALQLGSQHVYEEPWGGDNGDPCEAWTTGVFDDTNPNFRGFNVELLLANNSIRKIEDDWADNLYFVTANGEELTACYYLYDGMGPLPGATSSVTFFSVVPKGDYVSTVELLLEGEEIRLCLDGKGGSFQC